MFLSPVLCIQTIDLKRVENKYSYTTNNSGPTSRLYTYIHIDAQSYNIHHRILDTHRVPPLIKHTKYYTWVGQPPSTQLNLTGSIPCLDTQMFTQHKLHFVNPWLLHFISYHPNHRALILVYQRLDSHSTYSLMLKSIRQLWMLCIKVDPAKNSHLRPLADKHSSTFVLIYMNSIYSGIDNLQHWTDFSDSICVTLWLTIAWPWTAFHWTEFLIDLQTLNIEPGTEGDCELSGGATVVLNFDTWKALTLTLAQGH